MPEHDLKFSTTRSTKTVAIYVEMPPLGILVCSGVFLDTSEGTWVYKSEELQGALFGTDEVVIRYIDEDVVGSSA